MRDQVDELNEELTRQEQDWTAAAAVALPGRLTGRRVLLVSMRSSAKYIDGLKQLLTMAGAKVTGRVVIADTFIDPTQERRVAGPGAERGALRGERGAAQPQQRGGDLDRAAGRGARWQLRGGRGTGPCSRPTSRRGSLR